MAASSSQALEYLEGLTLQTHKKLYEQPSTVLAIFRCMLPHLAKSIVMAMLYMPTSFPSSDLDGWFHTSARKEKEQALYILERLHILVSKLDAARQSSYSLYAGFQRSLRQALEGSGSHRSFGVPANKNEDRGEKVSVQFLDQFAQTQWENILFYMVASTAEFTGNVGGEVGQGTKRLLAAGDFVRTVHGRVNITKEGFSFVLQETNAQVWTLLIVYLRHVSELGMSETDVLSFLFMLGSLELGQNYSTSTLSPTQLQMLEDLASMGIVYRSSKTASTFYPTRLAVTLTSDSGALTSASSDVSAAPHGAGVRGSASSSKGFIIIETNYRLYAYTSSLIQIAILSLFTKLNHRFPNLVSGKLTKESISRAVKLGISSAQIISYLTTYAHPQMQKQTPFIPPTVMDQIRLWEYEGERVETTNGYLMREFHTDSEYKDVLAYAEALGVLIWKNDAKRLFFISQIEQIQSYLKKKAQARGG